MSIPDPTPQPVTVADLTEKSWRRRIAALRRLPPGQPIPLELLPALVALLSAPEPRHREEAAAALARAGEPVVSLLVEVLSEEPEEEEADFRRAVVVTLGRIGAVAAPAVPVLETLLDDPWLGPCAQSALAAIAEEQLGGAGLPHLLGAGALLAVSAAVAWPASGGPDLLALATVVVLWSVAIGLMWTRPGAVAWVFLFAAGAAALVASAVAGRVGGLFAGLADVLKVG